MIEDTRNVTDEFKGMAHDDIVSALDARGVELEIAIENLERDFNMGTIVRSANAFGVRHIHIIGRRQWNKRGAMATDKYLHVYYYETIDGFVSSMKAKQRTIIAVDNVEGATDLSKTTLPSDTVLVFGSEGLGISNELINNAEKIIAIEQLGSTRSINVGVAAGILMYEWSRQNRLS